MGNSIEEDIKILEEMIENANKIIIYNLDIFFFTRFISPFVE